MQGRGGAHVRAAGEHVIELVGIFAQHMAERDCPQAVALFGRQALPQNRSPNVPSATMLPAPDVLDLIKSV